WRATGNRVTCKSFLGFESPSFRQRTLAGLHEPARFFVMPAAGPGALAGQARPIASSTKRRPIMFELYQLEQLLAVSECGTLSQAAEQLHLSQSALSRSMQRLEAELQVTLSTRQKNWIDLNECGRMAPQPDQRPGAGPGGEHHVLLCVPLRGSQGAEQPVPGVVLSAQLPAQSQSRARL